MLKAVFKYVSITTRPTLTGLALMLALGLAGTSRAQDMDTFSFSFDDATTGQTVSGRFTATRDGAAANNRQAYILADLLSVNVGTLDYSDIITGSSFQPDRLEDGFTWNKDNSSVTETEEETGFLTFGSFGSNVLTLFVLDTQSGGSRFSGTRNGEPFTFESTLLNAANLALLPPTPPPPPPPSPPEVAPMLERAVIDRDMLVLTYSEDLDEDSVPDTEDFTVTASGEAVEVSDVEVSEDTVTLTLESEVEAEDTVTVSYVPGDDPIREAEEGELPAAPLMTETVRNDTETPDRPDPPTAGDGDGGGCALASAGGNGIGLGMLFALVAVPFGLVLGRRAKEAG